MAGPIVIAKGCGPGNRPVYSPTPHTTIAHMYTPYSSTRNAIMRSATSRRGIPERRRAHAVTATPPAPPAANRRVAARPAIVIS